MNWDWLYLIAFLMFVGFSFRVASRISVTSLIDVVINAYLVFVGSVILTGFVLSWLDRTADRRFWAIGVFIPAFLFYLQFTRIFARDRLENFSFFELVGSRVQFWWEWFRDLGWYLKAIFGLMLATLVGLALINFRLVWGTVPNEWDSMTGHLVRVMYYLQHGNMRHFGGTNWNIDTYPKSICNLQIYCYLLNGRHENAFKIIHFASYWMGILAAGGVTYRITQHFSAGLFAALVYGLLPNVLIQAVTTETDSVLSSYVGCLLYYLFTYHVTLRRRYLYLAGLMFGIAFGHKITFALMLPSVFVIFLVTVAFNTRSPVHFIRRFKHLALGGLLGMLFFTLPTGYVDNLRVFGHPIGPPTATRHQSIERAGNMKTGEGRKNLLVQGSRNMARYATEFVMLDGLREDSLGNRLNGALRQPLIRVEKNLGLGLEEVTNFTINPFRYEKQFFGIPYWGVFGFALIWPLLFLGLALRNRAAASSAWIYPALLLAVLLHFAALSYSAPFDQWKGRYFQSTTQFAIPALGLLFGLRRFSLINPKVWALKSYIGLIVVLGCLSAIGTVMYNPRYRPFPIDGQKSAFQTGRIEQQTLFRPDIRPAYERFNQLVPKNATVALADINDDFEYPLFGPDLTRKLIPINPFEQGLQPIPNGADYLFFAASVIQPRPGDIRLGTDTTRRADVVVRGEDYYLRKLK